MFKQLPLGSAVDLFLDGWSWTQQTSRTRCKASGRGHQSQRPASADVLLVARNGHRSDHYQGEEGKEKRTSVSPGCPQSCGSTIFFWPKNIRLNWTVQEEKGVTFHKLNTDKKCGSCFFAWAMTFWAYRLNAQFNIRDNNLPTVIEYTT